MGDVRATNNAVLGNHAARNLSGISQPVEDFVCTDNALLDRKT
jgi:hypothetical protein